MDGENQKDHPRYSAKKTRIHPGAEELTMTWKASVSKVFTVV